MGEFTYEEEDRELGGSFWKWFLTKQHISISRDRTHLELMLPASKTDPFRKGIILTIAASQDAGCPVVAMKQLQEIDTHRPPQAPLFCVDRYKQHVFTREYVV